jgi:hypothetical protein
VRYSLSSLSLQMHRKQRVSQVDHYENRASSWQGPKARKRPYRTTGRAIKNAPFDEEVLRTRLRSVCGPTVTSDLQLSVQTHTSFHYYGHTVQSKKDHHLLLRCPPGGLASPVLSFPSLSNRLGSPPH